MDKSEGIKILKQLADGLDPHTGEVFPDDSPYQHPQTGRALYLAIMVLERIKVSHSDMKNGPTNAGKPWDRIKDDQLLACFENGMSIKELAQKHQRTDGAIQSRLIRLGKFSI